VLLVVGEIDKRNANKLVQARRRLGVAVELSARCNRTPRADLLDGFLFAAHLQEPLEIGVLAGQRAPGGKALDVHAANACRRSL
jgi:hypothetical protein